MQEADFRPKERLLVSDEPRIVLDVRGTGTEQTPAMFSNFLSVSRVATEVQFEFVFVDVNQIATALMKTKETGATEEPLKISGLTVAKVVVPALSFMQVREHLNNIFDAIEHDLGKLPEVPHGGNRVSST